ncbi:conjugal transfer pilus assembly protein TraW [Janthinobacterium sp. TND4EL3]|uniref:type-F conjugative transfer system protein TraW n=1 Tax=Janthinobacterium sp. TND4EL3 TaxID=1907311 RepID=UPI0009567C63|nr:type-F conjugative transfer system protein TraW [Janthinobacterium sp. TND4EL3]SIR86287.1 conjugal transfer pilus assembly protein TraW [Janthinobacterium sp. TND4EL3]
MRTTVILLLASGLIGSSAQAEELAAIGPTYPIVEQNLLDMIAQRLRALEKSGQLHKLQEQAVAKGRAAVANPAPVAGLTLAKAPRTVYVDPTFVLDKNILDAQGHVLFPAGTRTNPLAITSMSKKLLFFDARDPRQARMARSLLQRDGARIKPVLVGGSYLQLMKQWKTRIYFDQQGRLVRRFGIAHVPALVYQEGMRLRIDEIVVAK